VVVCVCRFCLGHWCVGMDYGWFHLFGDFACMLIVVVWCPTIEGSREITHYYFHSEQNRVGLSFEDKW